MPEAGTTFPDRPERSAYVCLELILIPVRG